MMEHRGESAIANYQGAFIFWMLKGFKGKFLDECIAANNRRNIITAYIVDVLLVTAMIYFYLCK